MVWVFKEAMLKQLYLTWKTRKCRGTMTLHEYHCFRVYKTWEKKRVRVSYKNRKSPFPPELQNQIEETFSIRSNHD